MAFPADLLNLAAAVGGNVLNLAFGGATAMSAGLNKLIVDLLATETKLGTGASTPVINTVLRGTATGATAYGQVQPADIADATIQVLASDPLTINGNMDHFQRVDAAVRTSTTTFNTTTSFAADRMFVVPAGASLTQQRSTSVPNVRSQYSLQINGAASVTSVSIGQRITSGVVNTNGKQSQVFSAYVRNDTGAAFTPNLEVGTPGSVDVFTTVTNRLNQALQSCADAAWTRVSWIFDPSAYTNLSNGVEVAIRLPIALTAGKVVCIAQFDVRPGVALMPYVPPDPDRQLTLSKLYFEPIGEGVAGEFFGTGFCYSTTSGIPVVTYSPKRAIPVVAISAVGDFAMYDAGATPRALGVLTAGSANKTRCGFTANAASGTPFTASQGTDLIANNTNARIFVNAELS